MGLTCTCKRFLCCKTECTQNPGGSLYGIRSDLPKSYTRHVPLHHFYILQGKWHSIHKQNRKSIGLVCEEFSAFGVRV